MGSLVTKIVGFQLKNKYPPHDTFGWTGGHFQKWSQDFETPDITYEEFGEMFEGDSADKCAGKFPLMLMGGRANGQACADGEQRPSSA